MFKGGVTAFADDTAHCSFRGITVCHNMNLDLNSLNWSFLNNRFVLRTEKTTYINFSTKTRLHKLFTIFILQIM